MQVHQPENRENAYASLLTGAMIFLICLLVTAFSALTVLAFIMAILSSNKFPLTDNNSQDLLTLPGAIVTMLFFGYGVLYSCRMISTQIRFLKQAE